MAFFALVTELDAHVAAELLYAARSGDRTGYRDALAKCTASVRAYVAILVARGKTAEMASALGVAGDDLAGAVLLKLTDQPPSRNDGTRPVATVLSWIKRVVTNEITDRWRKANVRAEQSLEVLEGRPSVRVPPAESPDPERIVAGRAELASVVAMLGDCYPHGIELAGAELEAASDAELASQLGITAANVQARRSRSQRYARAYRCLSQTPASRDEIVAREMGAPLTPNVRDIIGRVRVYVQRERRRGGGRC